MADRNYSPYQQKIIKRYFENYDSIKQQRLSDIAGELYLTEAPKKRERLWKQVEELLVSVEFPPIRVAHLMARKDPQMLVGILKELEKRADS